MSLAAALEAEAERGPGPLCTVGKLLDDLADADRGALQAALDDPSMTSARIFRALRKSFPGLRVPQQETLQRHRKGECRCDPC